MPRFRTRAVIALFLLAVFYLCFSSKAFADEADEKPSPPTMAVTPHLPSVRTFDLPVPPIPEKKALADLMPDMLQWTEESGGNIMMADMRRLKPLWPVHGRITSSFGPRGKRMHEGIDIPVPLGTPIQAALAGIVTQSRTYNGYGETVVLDHGNGVKTLYAHCSELLVQRGEYVAQGQVIAYAGDTGRSTTSHVHFGVFVKNAFRNPMELLKEEPLKFVGQPQPSSGSAQ